MCCTCKCWVQGEERDSSDEEWEIAFAHMDPQSQMGWRNRRRAFEGPGEQLMRDVYEAADEVHLAAMSAMAGSRNDEHVEAHVGVDATPLGSMLRPGDGCTRPTMSEEVEQEGECAIHCPKPSNFQSCKKHEHHGYGHQELPCPL